MNFNELKTYLNQSEFKEKCLTLYGEQFSQNQSTRYLNALVKFSNLYGENNDCHLFSASGRIEVSGNHTDHQLGQVIAAAIHLDTIAIVSKNNLNKIRLHAEGYDIKEVDLSDLKINKDEYYTSMGLIRGIAYDVKELTGKLGGFDAYVTSDVFSGSGLSSSASFEVLVADILNQLYADGQLTRTQLAQISQRAENNYFNKPCGLMDQMAIAQGDFCFIDFYNKENPEVVPLKSNYLLDGYTICLLQTGGSHADLSHAYAQITEDLKAVSKHFNQDVLSRIHESDFRKEISTLNQTVPTRAILRAHHYFEEIKRVQRIRQAILDNDIEHFKKGLIESGYSSYMYLQNIMHPTSDKQPLALALALAEEQLRNSGAWRVHGGGFGGTILMIVPNEQVSELKEILEKIYGENNFIPVHIRPIGVTQII